MDAGKLIVFLGVFGSLLGSAGAAVKRYDFRDAALRNLAQFSSEATFDRVVGVTSLVTGWLELDAQNPGEGIRGEIEIDLRGFETGMDGRNDWVRDKVFAAAENPVATINFARWTQAPRGRIGETPAAGKVDLTVKLRGVARAVSGSVKLSAFKESETTRKRLSGNLLKLTLLFDADVPAFGFNFPEGTRDRFARNLQFQVDLVGSDGLPTPAPPSQEGPKAKERK